MYDILFVDDDDTIFFIVSKYKMWKECDFKIKDFATNGRDALKMLKENRYDIVITDIRMPVVDGLEFLREIRENNFDIPVILASNYSDFSYAKEGIRLGAVDYMEKPYSESGFKETLCIAREILQRREKERNIDENCFSENEVLQYAECVLSGDTEKFLNAVLFYKNAEQELFDSVLKKVCEKVSWIEYLGEFDNSTDICSKIHKLKDICLRYETSNENSIVYRTCELIFRNMGSGRINDIIVEKIFFSRDYIGKIFKSSTGITVNDCITKMRIGYAKKLLKTTDMKVYEICKTVGYGTVDYFTKIFKKYVGFTPMQFKKL